MSNCTSEDFKSKVEMLESEIERLRSALENIANPIGHMVKTMPEGHKIDGYMAVMMAKNPDYLQDIAKSALSEHVNV
jgi:hypothetical protein